jgi:hypothetical protein
MKNSGALKLNLNSNFAILSPLGKSSKKPTQITDVVFIEGMMAVVVVDVHFGEYNC